VVGPLRQGPPRPIRRTGRPGSPVFIAGRPRQPVPSPTQHPTHSTPPHCPPLRQTRHRSPRPNLPFAASKPVRSEARRVRPRRCRQSLGHPMKPDAKRPWPRAGKPPPSWFISDSKGLPRNVPLRQLLANPQTFRRELIRLEQVYCVASPWRMRTACCGSPLSRGTWTQLTPRHGRLGDFPFELSGLDRLSPTTSSSEKNSRDRRFRGRLRPTGSCSPRTSRSKSPRHRAGREWPVRE